MFIQWDTFIDQGTMNSTKEFFSELLEFMWLRPERALHESHQIRAVHDLMPRLLQQPSLEYGCTDGVISFVLFGGKVLNSFDDYADISGMPANPNSEDYFSESTQLGEEIVRQPARESITYGVSWREAHLVRAARLGLYEELIRCDLNASIPLDDDCVKTIWAPNLFQNEPQDIGAVLVELKRLLKPSGTIFTVLPTEAQIEADFWSKYSGFPDQVIQQMDRGITNALTRNAVSDGEWCRLFAQSGLSVRGHVPFLPKIVSEVYQIGFRPMFPPLMEAYSLLRDGAFDDLMRLKRLWIETEFDFLEPLCEVGVEFGDQATPLWQAYQLEHSN